MTTYGHFFGLPIHLKLKIVKKCYPIPYGRLRRSCRFLDELCETNHRRLGIYPYQNLPHLYLLNSFNRSPFSETMEDIDKPHIVINYDRRNGYPGFLVPMRKENIRQIRRALSGFQFIQATVDSGTEDYIDNTEEFGEAVVHFLEVAAEFHIQNLIISHLSTSQVETMVTTLKTVYSVVFQQPMRRWDVLQLDCIKPLQKIKSLQFTFGQPGVSERNIQEFALGRKYLRFYCTYLDASISRRALENIIKSWAGIFPTTFCYAYSEAVTYYEANIYDAWHPLMPTNSLYLGNYCQQLGSTENKKPIKFDIWINERPDDNIFQLFYVTRESYDESYCITIYQLLTGRSKDTLIILIIGLLDSIYLRCPLDYSILYEEMCAINTLTGKRKTCSRLMEPIDIFYKNINRRTRTRQPPKKQRAVL